MEEESQLWAEAKCNSLPTTEPELVEYLCKIPKQLGTGYVRQIELYPELELEILDYEYRDDVLCKIPEWDHPLQFFVLLSGRCIDKYEGQVEDGGRVGEGYTCISGGGVQCQRLVHCSKSRYVGVDIHMSPDLLKTFFPDETGEISHELRLLAKGNDWQTLLHPKITTDVQGVTQQILNCPYQGITRRMYLLSKVLELMTLQLAPILASQKGMRSSPRLKAQTVARIHYAREILLSRMENPPSLLELAQMVGVSDRTLRRGFQELFGTTVLNYLTNERMKLAEQFLREGNWSVAEVANFVGYSHLGQFAAAFKRKFGIKPSECLLGKKSVMG